MGEAFGGLMAEHVLSRTVRDSAAVLDATAGPVAGDPYFATPPETPWLDEIARPPRRLRIAFSTSTPAGTVAHADCVRAVHETAKLCEQLGHRVEEAAPAPDPTLTFSFLTVYASGLSASVEATKIATGRDPSPELLEAMTWNLYRDRTQLTAAQYLMALQFYSAPRAPSPPSSRSTTSG